MPNQHEPFLKSTISIRFKDPTMPSANMCTRLSQLKSHTIPSEPLAVGPPKNTNFELIDQPTIIMPHTPKDDAAITYIQPKFHSII